MEKVCSVCGLEKDLELFGRVKKGCDVPRKALCKECEKLKSAERYKNNKEKILAKSKEYYNAHKEAVDARHREYYHEDKERERRRKRSYRTENREELNRRSRNNKDRYRELRKRATLKWKKDHPEKVAEYRARRHKERYASDQLYRARSQLRNAVRDGFTKRGLSKTKRAESILGRPFEEVLQYLGEIPIGSHIDHICPLAQAINQTELEALMRWNNLQVIPASDNMSKNDKPTEPGLIKCWEILGRPWIVR